MMLQHRGVRLPMRAWAWRSSDPCCRCARCSGGIEGGAWFGDAIDDQVARYVPQTDTLGRMLDEMRDRGEGFYQFCASCRSNTSASFSSANWRRSGRQV